MKKNFFIMEVLTFILGLVIWGGIVYYFDPAQQFRRTNYLYGESRIVNAGLAKNAKYDILIFGSSTSQNILKNDVEKLMAMSAINLSLSGATNYEQRKILELATKRNIQKIIYGLDFFSYNTGINESRIKIEEFVYENRKFYKYIYSFSAFKGIVKGIIKGKNSIDRLGYWGDLFEYSKENALSLDVRTQWGAQNIGAINGLKKGYNLDWMNQNFNTFLEIIKKNPKIEFIIYYPPYAKLWWDYAEEYGQKNKILNFKTQISKELLKLDNVKLYDFQNNEKIINDLNNYKDMIHFSPAVSKKIITEISEGKNRI